MSLVPLILLAAAAAGADWGGPGLNAKPPDGPAPPEAGPGEPQDDRVWVVIRAASRGERRRAAELGLSLEEFSGDAVAGVATRGALERLKLAGFKIEKVLGLNQFHPEGFPPKDEAYHDYGETQARLDALVSAHPGLASRVSAGRSLNGLDIAAIRFNTTASGREPSAKPGVLFLGAHHAREHLSTEVPLLLAQWLADNRSKPEVRRLLETRDIFIMPLVNPDGSEYDVSMGRYLFQRKNMRRNPDGTTGVDLNRNYGYHWGEGGASEEPGDETYRGPAPFSEPETRAVREFVEARKNIRMMLSYHTFSELILYPWSYTEAPPAQEAALAAYKAMARRMAEWTGYTPMQSADLYVASGETCDWAWGEKGVFCFTFELTPKAAWQGGFYPGSAVIPGVVEKNVPPALYLIGLADDPYRAAGEAASLGPLWRTHAKTLAHGVPAAGR